jgi:hypothetical protein
MSHHVPASVEFVNTALAVLRGLQIMFQFHEANKETNHYQSYPNSSS